MFFTDVPGRSGKMFVTKLHFVKFRQHKNVAFSVPIYGIAASFLSRGRTAHSTFKFPFDVTSSDNSLRYDINI